MELDLNEEPSDQTRFLITGFDSSALNDLQSVHGDIENRIRHLEVVFARARQRQRWRQGHTPIQITNFTGELTTDNVQDEGWVHQEEEVDVAVEGRTVESGRGGKRKSSQLIAKALGMEIDANNSESSSGSFFDCNICLDMARDPIVTCCGHLFCWSCFCQVKYAYRNAKECPVCKGEVKESGIIPIYGNASDSSSCQSESKETSVRVPPRPRAHRTESIRQQLINQGASTPTTRDIQRLINFIHRLDQRVQLQSPSTATNSTNVLVTQSRQETQNNQPTSSHQFPTLLVPGAASFPSLSSALHSAMDSAERIVEDLELYVRSHHTGRSRQLNHDGVNRDPPFSIAATNQSENHTPHVAATNFVATTSASPLSRNDDIAAVPDSEIQTTDSSMQIIYSDLSSSSSRRRADLSRRTSTEPRRRRFR